MFSRFGNPEVIAKFKNDLARRGTVANAYQAGKSGDRNLV